MRWRHATKVISPTVCSRRAAKTRISGAGSWPCARPRMTDEPRWCSAKCRRLNIYTQVDRRSEITGGQTDAPTDAFCSLCFILIHFKLLWRRLSLCLLLYCYLALKVKYSSIVLWELISRWCSCCSCCCRRRCRRESWYFSCADVLISLHQRNSWIIMASDCEAMPRASLHIIMRWRYDCRQTITLYLERNQPCLQNDSLYFVVLLHGAGNFCSAQKELMLSTV